MNFDKTLSFQSIPGVFSEEVCREIREKLMALPKEAWALRQGEMRGRGYPGETCHYRWIGPGMFPKDLYDRLLELAPKREDWVLCEICANKYLPGDYIGKHRDRDMYQINLVIPIQTGEDGVEVEGEFKADVAGQANIFYNTGPAHTVPAVKKERYLLIFLYTEKSQ